MSTYTVKNVGAEPREWSSSHGGTFLSYKVDLETEDGTLERGIEWNKKAESQPPAVDDRVAGHLEEGNYGPKFKMDYEATKELGPSSSRGGGSERSSGGGSKGNWQPEAERDPERAARILRQHSQGLAVQILVAQGGIFNGDISVDSRSMIRNWADWLDADVNQAGQAARGGQAISGAVGAPDATSDVAAESPASPSPPAGEEQRDLEMAIDAASAESLSAEARALVASYMISELSEEDRTRACNQLTNAQDPGAQGVTIRAMKKRTENWTGSPLPVAIPDPDSSIPF